MQPASRDVKGEFISIDLYSASIGIQKWFLLQKYHYGNTAVPVSYCSSKFIGRSLHLYGYIYRDL
jgi:hypothetical protein